jgi:hypothetical protein
VRIGIAIFSYLGTLNFGVTGDYDTTEDLDVLTRGIEAGVQELLDHAEVPRQNGHRRAVLEDTEAVAAAPVRSRVARRSSSGAGAKPKPRRSSTTRPRPTRGPARKR